MVDTPKDGDGEEATEADSLKKQPKRRHQRRRSKSRHSKNRDSGTGDNNTQKVPKTTPSSTIQRRRRQKQALTRGRQTKRSRMIITYLPPETRQASTTTNSSCLRIPSNKSISDAG